MKTIRKVIDFGRSKGITIPPEFKVDEYVKVEIKDDTLIVRPVDV